MKKKLGILLILGVCTLVSGCGAKPSKQKKQVNDKATQVYVTPIPCSKEELIKKYPDRFDAKGNIVYPLRPGSKEYNRKDKEYTKKYQEAGIEMMKQEVNTPEDLVKRLDTKTLLQATEDNPYLNNPLGIYESLDIATECIEKTCGEATELFKREDAYYAAYQSYTGRDLKLGKDDYENMLLTIRVVLEQYLLLQEHGYRKLTAEERKEVKQAVQKNQKVEQEIVNRRYGPCLYRFDDDNNMIDDDYSRVCEAIIDQDGNPWKDYLSQ